MWLQASGTRAVDPDRGPVFDGVHLALEAANAGYGVALALSPLVEDDLASGRLVRPFGFELRSAYSFWVVCSRARAHTPKIRSFREWLLSEGRSSPQDGGRNPRM